MSDDDVTAYHESGHAVMGVFLGGVVQHVSLRPESSVDWDDEFPRYGDTRIAWPTGRFSQRQHAEREIQTALAGPVSQMVYSGDEPQSLMQADSVADWHAARRHATALIADERKRVAYLGDVLRELADFFHDDSVWAAVAALADELLVHDILEAETIHTTVGFWLRRR